MTKTVLMTTYDEWGLGPRLLASWMLQNGHETHILTLGAMDSLPSQTYAEDHEGYQYFFRGQVFLGAIDVYPVSLLEWALLEQYVREQQPELLGFSARSISNPLLPKLIPVLRRAAPKALLVAGGFAPTFEPHLYLDAGFDVVVRGDGEEALLDLADCIGDQEKLRAIPNTCWKDPSGYLMNPLRPQEKNLSKYPPPLYGDEYCSYIMHNVLHRDRDPMQANTLYTTMVGRGCIGKCTYCSGGQWSTLYKDQGCRSFRIRNRNITDVLDELRKIDKDVVSQISFADEFFMLDTKNSIEFFKQYKKDIGIRFYTHLIYERMLENRELFELVMSAGLDRIGVGLQAGSEEFARKHYLRNHKNSSYLEFMKILFENNVYVALQIIGGNCYETEEDLDITLDFIKQVPFTLEDTQKNFIMNTRLKVLPETPITLLTPRVVTDPMSAREWMYRAVMMEMCRILDADELAEVRADARHAADPVAFRMHYIRTLFQKRKEHYARVICDLQGQDLVFYGAGKIFHENKQFFGALSPSHLLVDRKDVDRHGPCVNGVPVAAMEDFMGDRPDVKVLIFDTGATLMQRNLVRGFGLKNENIHVCTSVIDQQVPC